MVRPRSGPSSEQCRKLVARKLNILLQLLDALPCRRYRRLGLPEFEARIETGRSPVPGECIDLLALLQRLLGYIEQQVRALQVYIGLRDGGRQRETRRVRVDFSGLCLIQRAFVGGAVLSPEIDLPIQRELELVQRDPALPGRGWRDPKRRRMFAREFCVSVDARVQVCLCAVGQRDCLPRPCGGNAQRRAAAQALVDQAVELRVVERAPPIIRRPRSRRESTRRERFFRRELVGALHARHRRQARGARASSKDQHCDEYRNCEHERPEGHAAARFCRC